MKNGHALTTIIIILASSAVISAATAVMDVAQLKVRVHQQEELMKEIRGDIKTLLKRTY